MPCEWSLSFIPCIDQHENEHANGVYRLLIELRDVSFGGQIYFKYFSMWNPFKPSESSLALPFPEFILFLHFTITEKPLKQVVVFLSQWKKTDRLLEASDSTAHESAQECWAALRTVLVTTCMSVIF